MVPRIAVVFLTSFSCAQVDEDSDGSMLLDPLDSRLNPCLRFLTPKASFRVSTPDEVQVLALEILNDGHWDNCGGAAQFAEVEVKGPDREVFRAGRPKVARLPPGESTTIEVRYQPPGYLTHRARLEVFASPYESASIDLVGQVGEEGPGAVIEEPSIPLSGYTCTFAQAHAYRLNLVQVDMLTGTVKTLPKPISAGSTGRIVGLGHVGNTWYYSFLREDGKIYGVNPEDGAIVEHTPSPRSNWTITDQDGARLALFQRESGRLTKVQQFTSWSTLLAQDPAAENTLTPSGPYATLDGDQIVTAGDRATGLVRYRLGDPNGQPLVLAGWDRDTGAVDLIDGHLMVLGTENRESEETGRVPLYRFDLATGNLVHRTWLAVNDIPGSTAPSGLSCTRN